MAGGHSAGFFMKIIMASPFSRFLNVILLVLATSIVGCTNAYRISTFDGKIYQSRNPPRLEGEAYQFESENGHLMRIPTMQVKSIKPE
jgi:hypothetical protein